MFEDLDAGKDLCCDLRSHTSQCWMFVGCVSGLTAVACCDNNLSKHWTGRNQTAPIPMLVVTGQRKEGK